MEQRLHKSLRLAATLLVALCASSAGAFSGSIDLTFAGRGESSTVNKVVVTNISKPGLAPVTLNGTDILRLVDPDDPDAIESTEELQVISEPILTPNPSFGDGTLIFDAKSDGPVRVSVYTTGGMLLDAATLNVSKGRNTARIPAQATGIYIVNIDGQGVKSSTRWMCGGSKSFSGISLGGAQQWSEVTLPTKTVFRSPSRKDANAVADVVMMDYSEGDILRFEGTSGKMRTIMHVSPESSHAITFDFFKCEDVNGYNYPIVRIGDMLWMLEDLQTIKKSGMTKTSSPNIWKNIGEYDPAVFESNGRAYYTINGGRMALPEGWNLPSIDEIYAFVKDLQADTMKLGDFLKDRSYEDWPMALTEGPDTIHLQLMAHGYINENGELINDEVTGAWATNNTQKHGCSVSYEISAMNSKFSPRVTHEKRSAFTVRGCRHAPSVYNEMLVEQFKTEEAAQNARRKIPMQKVNSNGPLGEYYTYGADRKSVFFDYTGNQMSWGNTEQRSGVLFKKNEETGWKFESKNLVPTDVNGNHPQVILRKVTAQGNADGYENVVYASWSKYFRAFFDGKTKGSIPSTSTVMGEGVVNITIFGDSIRNHAILDGYATRPLLDKNGNEYVWTMPTFNGNQRLLWTMSDGEKRYGDIRSEYFARAFNLKCIQDQTGDGVEEIVMNVGNKIAVFDGVTLRCLRERTYADDGSYLGTPNLRFDVADVDGDGYKDIVMVVNTNIDLGYLYVYSQGHIDEEPIFTKPLGAKCLFCDVKVGNMSNSDLPEIAILTRGMRTNHHRLLEKSGYLYMSRLYYDDDLKLKEKVILPKTAVDAFAENDDLCYHLGNMDLVFGYFRGQNLKGKDGKTISYTQDLVVGDGLWRWDETNAKPTYRFQVLAWTKSNYYTIPADAITAVQTRENDKESLIYIWDIDVDVNGMGGYPTAVSEFCEVWLGDNGTTVYKDWSFAPKVFGWGNVGPHYSDWVNTELTKWYDYGQGTEINSHPTLCKFADRSQAKRFKFVSYDVAFSEPRIYAALAAAPYYEDLPGSDNASTTWGKTKSDGTSSAHSDTWGGSIIMGYEHSYSAPFLSSMNAGVEFTAKVSASAGIATEHEDVITYGVSYSTTQEHVVVMQATPYDVYTYEIIGSNDPDEMGTTFQVSMPRKRVFIGLALEDYVRLMASQKGVGKPQLHLTSTPGKPFTYPENFDYVPYIIRNNDDYPFRKAHDLNGGETNEMVGTGGVIATRSIEIESSTTHTTTVEIGVETELVGTLMGIKAGVGFNYNHTNESSHTFSEGLAVEGAVSGLPSNSDRKKYPQFRWNLVWYYVKDVNGEIYPVINYIVTP